MGLKEMLQDALAQLETEKQVSYDEGFAAGSAGQVQSDKIFSQEELNASLLSKESDVKASLLAAYEAQQVVESAEETGFKDLLK